MTTMNFSLTKTLPVAIATAALLVSTAALSKRATSAAGDQPRSDHNLASGTATTSASPTPRATTPATGAPRVKPAAVQATPPEFKSVVRVFVHPDDIYPIVASVRPGKVIISAENNAGKDVAVVIEPVLNPGHVVARVPAVSHDKRNKQEFSLAPGEYVFYEQSHPKRQGKLIVDPKFR